MKKKKTKSKNKKDSLINRIKIFKNNIYFSFYDRLIFKCILSITVLTFSLYFLINGITIIKQHEITFKHTSDIDYKVYLKDNTFYEKEYLEKNMVYISTLIKNINANFVYNFVSDENMSADFTYNITGRLIIMDSTGKNTFYEKEYLLLNNKNKEMIDTDNFQITETVNIDYIKYNKIANDFKNNFGVNTISNFIVSLNVNNVYNKDSKKISLSIPLSEREVVLNIESTNVENKETIIKNDSLKISNVLSFAAAIIMFIPFIISMVNLIKSILISFPKRNDYDAYLYKILKEYDRLIVNTNTRPIIKKDDKIIKVNDFQELLDVRDNIKKPIKYYNITSHHKCLFYINNDSEIYQYTLKSIDINNK